MKNLLILFLLFIVVISCDKKISLEIVMGKTIFYYDSINSKLVDPLFKYDSLFIIRNQKDSMTITRYVGGDGYHNRMQCFLENSIFYENRAFPQILVEGETETSNVLVPLFSLKDTAFNYIPIEDYTSFFVIDLGFDKCNYQIEKNENGFVTIKRSLIEKTYVEEYYYDNNFNVYKIVNTWKKNKCIYLKNN